ncbi:MAG: endonuclease III [Nitrospirae bacterium RIFCSPLOWO2_12_FULL_63_8]|nr:MAG: endonuclease III [Nitrospirae bacterium RIFCSPLOWO2_12_FULL_63_8]
MPVAHRQKQPAPARARAARIFRALRGTCPAPQVELRYRTALQLLIATILSAQCTDQRVNQVTPALFRRYRTAGDYAAADPVELERLIKSTGFFKSKARNIMGCCRALLDRFGGEVPDTMEALVTLPGVGRKTANVVLGNHFGKPAVVVDTHVIRVSQRLGLSASGDPERIEEDLQRLMPPGKWTAGSQRLLLHGRYVCLARAPKCRDCCVYALCRWKGKQPR